MACSSTHVNEVYVIRADAGFASNHRMFHVEQLSCPIAGFEPIVSCHNRP